MTTTLFPSTWIQALPILLKRLIGAQKSSSSSPDQAQTSQKDATDHDDEWGDWVIPTPEREEQVEYVSPLFKEPREDENILFEVLLEELIARQRVMAHNAWKIKVRDKDRKSSDGEKEEEPFHLEEIPAGIRMSYHTPPDFDNTQVLGTCILDLDASRW